MRWRFLSWLLWTLFPLLATAQTSMPQAKMDSLIREDSLRTAQLHAANSTDVAVDSGYQYDNVDSEAEAPAEPHYLWDQAVPVNSDTLDGYHNASLTLRKVPAVVMEGLKKDKALNYNRKPKAIPSFGWLDGILLGIAMIIKTFYLVIIIVVLAGLGLLIFLFLKRNGYLFTGKIKTETVEDGFKEMDNLAVNDYDKEIQAAISERKFRLAVRLLYLQTLRLLADRQSIVYSRDKTNAAYLRELSPTPFYKPFARLTLDYEYIWYGELSVDDRQFSDIHRQFGQFMNELGYTR